MASPVVGSYVVNHVYLVTLAPVIGLVADDLGVGIAAVGLAIGVQGGIVTLLQLPLGYLFDARSRTLVLAVSLGFGAAGIVATAFAPSCPWLLASQALLGVGVAGHHLAHYPLLTTVSPETNRGQAYSLHVLGGSLGSAASYAITAGVGAFGFGWRWTVAGIAVFGAAFTLVALLVARGFPEQIRKPTAEDHPSSRSTLAGIRRGALELLSSSGLMGLAFLSLLASVAAWCIRTYSPQLLTAGYGLAPGTANLPASAMPVVDAGTILVGGAFIDRVGPGTAALGGYAVLAGLAALLATGSIPLVLIVSILPFSGTISVSRPARSALADRPSERADLGKNFAVVTVGISLGGATAPPAFGALIDLVGVCVTFGVAAVLGLLSFGLARWFLGRVDGSVRRLQATPSD